MNDDRVLLLVIVLVFACLTIALYAVRALVVSASDSRAMLELMVVKLNDRCLAISDVYLQAKRDEWSGRAEVAAASPRRPAAPIAESPDRSMTDWPSVDAAPSQRTSRA